MFKNNHSKGVEKENSELAECRECCKEDNCNKSNGVNRMTDIGRGLIGDGVLCKEDGRDNKTPLTHLIEHEESGLEETFRSGN